MYLAIIGAGCQFVGSNPAYKSFELKRLFTLSKTKCLMVEPSLVPNIWSSAVDSGLHRDDIFLFDTQGESTTASDFLVSWNILLQNEEEPWLCIKDEILARQTTAALLLTSGTSGLPKAAMMSHYALLAQAVLASYAAGHILHKVLTSWYVEVGMSC